MTCQHNYMQSPIDSSRRFCCICGEPEENVGATDVCGHGGLLGFLILHLICKRKKK